MRSKKPRWWIGLALGLALSVGLPLASAERVSVKAGTPERRGSAWTMETECNVAARNARQMLLRAGLGSIKVRSGAADRLRGWVRVTAYTTDENEAKRLLGQCQLSARPLDAGRVLVESRVPGGAEAWSRLKVEIEFEVPVRFSLDLETQAGDIEVEHLRGQLRATTAGGNISSADIDGPVKVETAGGSIALGNIAGRLEARTAGGTIRAGDVKESAFLESYGGGINVGRVGGAVVAETAAGDVVVRGAVGNLRAETSGGQIWIGEANGSINAQTAGGTVYLQGGRGNVNVNTAGGSIDLWGVEGVVHAVTRVGRILAHIEGTRQSFGPSTLQTSMGDVQVYLPPDLPLTIDAAIERAGGFRIESDFPLNIGGAGAGYVASPLRGNGNLNGGGNVLSIRTVAGNIKILRVDPATIEKLKRRQEIQWGRREPAR